MDKLYIVICPSVNIGRDYADRMGWKEANCAFICKGQHLRGVAFHPDDTIHAIMPVTDELWRDLQLCSRTLPHGSQVKIHLIQWP